MIIEGIQISIPARRRPAIRIIESMELLLRLRWLGQVSRAGFILRWGRLRKALFMTHEYQAFRQRVFDRCGGVCEFCGRAPAIHAHHVHRVAMKPRLALVSALAKGSCRECHKEEHADEGWLR